MTTASLSITYHLQQRLARPQLSAVTCDWPTFVEAITYQHDERAHKDGPLFVLADFSPPYRLAANVGRYSAVLLDMDTSGDGAPPQPEFAVQQIQRAGLAGIVYTTHNHLAAPERNEGKPAGPRYRVIVPLQTSISPADLERVTRALASALALDGPGLDPKSWVVAQAFFMPSCRPGAPRLAQAIDGEAFDPETADKWLPAPGIVAESARAATAPSPSPAGNAAFAGFDAVKAQARGRWPGILSSLGITVPSRPGQHAPCPGCGGRDRFRFDDRDGAGSWLCSQGGAGTIAGDGFDLVAHVQRVDAAGALRAVAGVLGMSSVQRSSRAAAVPAPSPASAPTIDQDTGEIHDAAPAVDAREWPAPIDPFGVSAPPPLPIDVLPVAFRAYVRDQAELLGCDPAIIGMSAIVAAAACITDAIEVQPKRHDPTWTEQARLWLAVVGDPSAKKSPAIKKAMRQVNKIDMRMVADNERAAAEHAQQHAAWKEAKKAKGGADISGAEPKKPPARRLLVEDVTVEALSEVLRDNPAGVLTFKDELTGWFASMDAYKGSNKGASMDRAHWLEAYNGNRRVIDRISRGSIIVPNWSTCIIGGIQPDMMRKVSASMGNDGLLQRFMVINAQPASADQDRSPDMRAMDDFRDLFEHLAGIQAGSEPIRLTEAAHVCRERVGARAAAMVRSFDHQHLVAWVGKWPGLFARLLLTYHVLDCAARGIHPGAELIGGDTARLVERLMCDVLLHHTIHFYTEVIDQHERLENTRQLARLVLAKRLDRLTKRDITLGWRAARKMENFEVRATTDALCTLGWLEPEPGSIDSMDGRPKAWTVNPLVHEVFERQAAVEAVRRRESRELMRELITGR